jgi:hypothetical protein
MKERDIRVALGVLLSEGWIQKTGTSPSGTHVYRVRMESKRTRRPARSPAPQAKTAAPLPHRGTPQNAPPPPPVGESPAGAPLPYRGTPLQGDPNKKPINEEEETQEELIPTQKTNMSQHVADTSPAGHQVTTADAVATDHQVVVTSVQNDAPQRHDNPPAQGVSQPEALQPLPEQQALPDFARIHRPLLVEWGRKRRSKHPDAPRGLSPADLAAIHHAEALGVLQPFLEQAAASGCKTLATGYKRRCEQLRAGPAAAAAFETLRIAYMAAPHRVTCQSLPAAQRELVSVLAEGITPDQLVAALRAEIRAQQQQQAVGEFVPSLPDIARWLKQRRFFAYLSQPTETAPAPLPASIDPETGVIDPFAYHRQITTRQ